MLTTTPQDLVGCLVPNEPNIPHVTHLSPVSESVIVKVAVVESQIRGVSASASVKPSMTLTPIGIGAEFSLARLTFDFFPLSAALVAP